MNDIRTSKELITAPENPTLQDLIAFYGDGNFRSGVTVRVPYRATRCALEQVERLQALLALETGALEQACAAPVDAPLTVQQARAGHEPPDEQLESAEPLASYLEDRIRTHVDDRCIDISMGRANSILQALRDLQQFHDWALPQTTNPPQSAQPPVPAQAACDEFEPVGWQYQFHSPYGGLVWTESSHYNGRDPIQSRQVFAKRPTATKRAECQHDKTKPNPTLTPLGSAAHGSSDWLWACTVCDERFRMPIASAQGEEGG